MPRTTRWTVAPGRNLHFDGQPTFALSSEGDPRFMPHVATDAAAHLIAEMFNRSGVTPETLYKKTMGHPRHAPSTGRHPHARRAHPRESRVVRDNWRDYAMTYGEVPPFDKFERDIRRPDPEHGDGRAYWPAGTMYPMELVSPEEIELAHGFGALEEFETDRRRTGQNRRATGFRGDEQTIYDFVTYLSGEWSENDNEAAGDLASSIMTTLGYEWI